MNPKVHIITTGGTIASQTDAPMIEGQELIGSIPGLTDYADIEAEELVRIGSSKMTPEIWLKLLNRIHEILSEKENLSSIVITHGTDTMEETAFFLHLTVKSDMPVILTGSMRSSTEVSPDGPANLINAIRTGISSNAIGNGVLIVMNEYIGSARDTRKVNNRRVNAFISPELGYLGSVESDTVIFYREPVKPHTVNTEFDVAGISQLPTVALVQDFTDFDREIMDFYLTRNVDGIVVSSFAGGRMSAGMTEAIENRENKTIPIVIASRIPDGRIQGTANPELNLCYANDLTPNKARILLMLALTRTRDIEEIQAIFERY